MRPHQYWSTSSGGPKGPPLRAALVAVAAALSHWFVILGPAVAATARLLAAAVHLVDRGPGAPFGFVFGHAVLEIPFLDVLGLPLLFIRVFAFIPSRHGSSFFLFPTLSDARTSPPPRPRRYCCVTFSGGAAGARGL